MEVGYDDQAFLAQPRGGITRYFASIIASFRADASFGVAPVLGWSSVPNDHARDAGLSKIGARVDAAGVMTPTHYVCAARNTLRRARARRAGVLHHTYYHPAFFAPRYRGARVTTVYDMTPELFPELFLRRNPHLDKRRYVFASDMVICISEATRRDLVAVYGDPGVPMPVVPLGVDRHFRPRNEQVAGLPERFVLFVGQRGGYKGFDVLVEALATMRDRSVGLVAAGGGPFTVSEDDLMTRCHLQDRVVNIRPTDAVLATLYSQATLFVLPSRNEGFGLPVLEAMACGCPVVLARAGALPEVGGDVARYFEPADPDALGAVIDELTSDAQLRARLSEAGRARAAAYTPEATAALTAAQYHRLSG